MTTAAATTGALYRVVRVGAGLVAFTAATPLLAQANADPSAPVTGAPVLGMPTTGFGAPADAAASVAAPPPPAAPAFGALGAGAQRPPGAASPAFPVRSFGDDPATENAAAGLGRAAGMVLGRFYATAGLDSLYDSNILRLNTNVPVLAGRSRSDLRLTPLLEIGASLPVGRQRVFGSVLLGRDFYVENQQLNRNRFRFDGGVELALGTRCSGTADVNVISQQALLAELSVFVPNVQDTLSYGFAGECRTASGLAFGGTVRRLETRNENITRSAFNNNSLSFGPQISYGRPTLGTFSLSANWTDAGFPNRPAILPSGAVVTDDIRIFQGRFGYSRSLGPRLNLVAGVSVFRNEPRPETVVVAVAPGVVAPVTRRSATTVGFDVAASYNSGSRLTAQASASLVNRVSLNVGAISQKRQDYGLDIGYRLGRRFLAGVGVNYVITDFEGSFATPDEAFARNQDKLFRVVGSLDYAPGKLYSIGVEVAHQNRTSDPVQFSFESTSVRLRLRVNYGRRG